MPSAARRLLLAWGALMLLSGALALFADVRHSAPLSSLGVATTALAVIGKCRIVLAEYLDLRRSPRALRGFLIAVAAIVAFVSVSFLPPLNHVH